jgi:hypothetical protein
MSCELCRTFILDYLHHPLHPENRLTALFHHSNLLVYKETLCFWIQRALVPLTPFLLKKAKSDTEMDFYLDNIHQVEQEAWNKVFLNNLKGSNLALRTELNEFQTICEECGFLKNRTELFFLENYILPLLQTVLEIHTEHSTKSTYIPTAVYTDNTLREEWGDLYD